ncbi:penicillin-binding protein activator [Colwelliaceae bacterium BS250]
MTKITLSFRSFLPLFLGSLILLQGCGTQVDQPKETSQATNKTIEEIEVIEDSELTADDLVNLAEDESSVQATVLLLQAAAKYIQEQKIAKSLFISYEVSKLPLTAAQKNYNQLNLAHGLYEAGLSELAHKKLLTVNRTTPSKRQLILTAQINVQRGLLVTGIVNYLDYYQQFPSSDINDIIYLNSLFASLKPWQISALSKQKAYDLDAWLSFTEQVSLFGNNHVSLQSQLQKWQENNKSHPANLLITDLQQVSLNLDNVPAFKKVVVLIPLSGRQAILGKTLQAGILAAYQQDLALDNNQQQIMFIDTNNTPMVEIMANLTAIQPDFVIGPLLKNHVDNYLAATTPVTDLLVEQAVTEQSNNTPIDAQPFAQQAITEQPNSALFSSTAPQTVMRRDWPTLLLNLPEKGILAPQHYAFSMLPEDEATQAAFSLSKKGFKQGLILSQNSAIGKRMANSFAQQWQLQTGSTPTIVYYPTGKKMQNSVKGGLDVNLSDERIFLLRNRLQENLKTETRNRRDIDFIYMFATPDQAKLLKPYIDVNTSPFANVIPIYASSRSNSDAADRNTRRDLTGLTFTDIPWLLSGKAVNPDLTSQAKQIWPNRSSALERIYAMGIDSWQLTPKVEKMQAIPLLRHKGETGDLQMNNNRVISRSFYWGRYRSSRIQNVKMD